LPGGSVGSGFLTRVVGKAVTTPRLDLDGESDGISVGSGVGSSVGTALGTVDGDRVGASVMGSTQISLGWKSSKQPLIKFCVSGVISSHCCNPLLNS